MNILEWLRDKGYDCTWNVKIGSKIPDIIAFKEDEIVALEIKKGSDEVASAIGQCLHYLKGANKAYIILPRAETKNLKSQTLSILKKHGIGLIELNDDIKILLEAKKFPLSSKSIIESLKDKSLTKREFDSDKNVKQKILDTISEHPEGLTIQDLSTIIGVHRQTITKYVLWLEGNGKIFRRRIGAVTLNYLKKDWERLRK